MEPSSLRVLLVGDLTPFVTTSARVDAFRELEVELETVDLCSYLRPGGKLRARLSHWTLRTPDVFRFNRAIEEAARRFEPTVIWIEKGTQVFPATLRRLRRDPSRLIVYHNTDDWKAKTRLLRIHWRYLLRSLDLYHVHITSNLHNVKEFRERGFRRVHHMELAANPAVRDPGPLSAEERMRLGGPVGFIGHWEPFTERALARVVEAEIPLRIYGGGWEKAQSPEKLGDAVQYRYVGGDEYARAIRSFDVNIGIVSKWNRNHTASRTFQIPALGAFLLHERNEVVTEYFREGVEAEFFGSEDELVEKCRHYLAHPEERARIAEAGRRRCLDSGYFEVDRVREILPVLERGVEGEA